MQMLFIMAWTTLARLLNLFKSKNALLILIYLIAGGVIVPHFFQTLPYSIFYIPHPSQDRQAVLDRNAYRTKNALAYLQSVNSSVFHKLPNVTNPNFCFIVITNRRPVETHYLTQVVGTLLPQIVADDRSAFTIYNAEGPTHEEAVSLSSYVPVVNRQNVVDVKDGLNHPSGPASFDRERADYVMALEWCSKKGATYTTVIEDDALPCNDFIPRLRFILNYRMNKNSNKWLYLKLFYPEKFQGWGNEVYLVIELIALSCGGGILLTLLSIVFLCENVRKLDCKAMLFRLILSSLFTTFCLMVAGRPHFMALRKMSVHLSTVSRAPGCCTPALLFRNGHISELLNYLRTIKCTPRFPIDLAIDAFADDRGLERLLVEPNLFRHIGYISSLPGKGWKNVKEFMI